MCFQFLLLENNPNNQYICLKSGMHLMIASDVVCGRSIQWTLENINNKKKRVRAHVCLHRHNINLLYEYISKINWINNQTKHKAQSKHFHRTNFSAYCKKSLTESKSCVCAVFFAFEILCLANHSILIIFHNFKYKRPCWPMNFIVFFSSDAIFFILSCRIYLWSI